MSLSQSPPYLDHADVFSTNSTMDLPKYSNINNHLIDLVDNKQPSYDLLSHLLALQYCSSVNKTIILDYLSEVLLIQLSRSNIRYL